MNIGDSLRLSDAGFGLFALKYRVYSASLREGSPDSFWRLSNTMGSGIGEHRDDSNRTVRTLAAFRIELLYAGNRRIK